MPKDKFARALVFIIGSELLGSIGTLATAPSIPTWYAGIVKPSFNPPNWVFGPVWTTLFALMGYSAFLIYESGWKKKEVKKALTYFGIQFLLNILWSFIFFGANFLFTAFSEILLLWFFILLTIIKFYKIDKKAGLLLLPYLAWVAFAAYLNLSIALLNRF